VRGYINCRPNLRAPLGMGVDGASNEEVRRRVSNSRNAVLFERLKTVLTDEADRPSQAQIADELAMTENAVNQAFHRLRERYRQLLREEIAHTVMTPGDIEDELRHLIAVLRA